MNQETLDKANTLAAIIRKLKGELDELSRPNIILKVLGVNGGGSYLFATIGTEENCEHPDVEAAAQMLNRMIQRRMDTLAESERQLAAL